MASARGVAGKFVAMIFASPFLLLLLLLLPWIFSLVWWRHRLNMEATLKIIGDPASHKMGIRWGELRSRWRIIVNSMLMALLIAALAGPGLGPVGANSSGTSGSVMFIMDLSRSMAVRDCQGVSRLEASRAYISARLAQLDGLRVGLTGFAGEGQVLVPITTDFAAVRTLLGQAQPGLVGGIGSRVEAGLREALKWMPDKGERVLVLLSDGETTSGDIRPTLRALRDKGVRLFIVGLGSNEGGKIPVRDAAWGDAAYLTYRGEPVISRRSESAMQEWMFEAGGRYLAAEDESTGAQAFASLTSVRAGQAELPTVPDSNLVAPFQWILALALLLIVLEQLLELGIVFGDVKPLGRRAGVWLFHGLIGAGFAFGPSVLLKGSAWPHWLLNREALQAAQQGQFTLAENRLRLALRDRPDDATLLYNLGYIQYEAGQFAKAKQSFEAALAAGPDHLHPTIRYNLGNAWFRLAERGRADGYQQAIAAYEQVVKQKPDDVEARQNLELARARLKKNAQSQRATPPPQQSGAQGARTQSPQTVTQAPNLPNAAEVDALLDALEHEEREQSRAQAENDAQAWSAGSAGWEEHFVAEQKNW